MANDMEMNFLMNLGGMMDEEAEIIPLLSADEEEVLNNEDSPTELSILPLKNNVLFPGVVIPITVGRDKSIKLVKEANSGSKLIGVIAQKDANIEEPTQEQLYEVGTVAQILKMLRMPDGSTTIIIQGKRRFTLKEITATEPYLKARVEMFQEPKAPKEDPKFDALVASIKDLALQIIQLSPNIPSEASIAIKNIESPSFLISFISANMNADMHEKQTLLEITTTTERANRVLEHLTKEVKLQELKNDIQSKVKVDIDKQQREYFLHQQMKTIQEELGGSPQEIEVAELREKAKNKKWSKETEAAFAKELEKLGRMNSNGMEYSVQLNYLETLIDLPWNEFSKDNFDLKRATKILNRDHYGLDEVKDRLLEHLAVLKLKGDMKSPILVLNGPPGVGKTSLGKSVAEALGRSYVRMSLGGLHDEAEIRGHRKTYIGALPGRIIQNMKKAKSSNPVFILDEIDKVGQSMHGDPSSALLEVLDPEQNKAFYDNYLELDYDLSKVLFIATSNNIAQVQPALRDRMELINIAGYTIEEKLEIAKKHLIPKLLKEHGLSKEHLTFGKGQIEIVIEEHTRESGVRQLEKVLAKVVRQVAKKIAMDEPFVGEFTDAELRKILGPGHAKDKYQDSGVAGVVTGLAWTAVGGDILFIESSITKGRGKLTLTGNLGAVMKESAVIALEYLKAHAETLELKQEVFDKYNVHVHVPEGATPKDGPSAGITMLTALASLFTQRKVKQHLAMTGEITLRGKVLPVGGIKEKILAAKRAKIKEIILCEDNRQDIEEITPSYLKGLTFHYVKTMTEVLEIALLKSKVTNALKITAE